MEDSMVQAQARNQRVQRGHVFEVRNAAGKIVSFHVRYRVTELQPDGSVKRVLKSHKLVDRDEKYFSASCKAVQSKCDEFMQALNPTETADVLISDFWTKTYWPYLQKTKKASTLNSYQKLWNAHLSPAFAGVRLSDYTVVHATRWLTSLVEKKKQGRRSLAHIRSLASGMFRHAKQLGYIEENPIRDSESHIKPEAPEGTHAYTLEEAESIVNTLLGNTMAQLIFMLATFLGLRPGEISGLKLTDIDSDWIHIRRAAWNGIVGSTKTEDAVASVPLIEPVRSLFSIWKLQCPPSPENWCFPNRNGGPMEMNGFCRRVIMPILRTKNIEWHGLYAGRRAAGTLLTQLTGNAVAAQYVLRHANLGTTEAFYIKPSREEAVTGLRLLEEKLAGRFPFASKQLTGQTTEQA
jgi:integrase